MKAYIKHTAQALLAGALIWATPTFAQQSGSGALGYQAGRNGGIEQIFESSDELIARALAVYASLPDETKDDIEAFRDALEVLKDVWVTEYQPDEDATLEEIRTARQAFAAAMEEELQVTRELRKDIVAQLRGELRDNFQGEIWTDETRALYEEYNAVKRELAVAWQAVVADLGTDATREDIAAAKEQFKEDYAELIAQQKEMAMQLRDLVRSQVQANRPLSDREALPPELQALRDAVRAQREAMRAQRQSARQEMAGLSEEEREAKRQEILGEMKQAHNELKERRRELAEGIEGMQDGDRRPED